jgi:hypothetical protein
MLFEAIKLSQADEQAPASSGRGTTRRRRAAKAEA